MAGLPHRTKLERYLFALLFDRWIRGREFTSRGFKRKWINTILLLPKHTVEIHNVQGKD